MKTLKHLIHIYKLLENIQRFLLTSFSWRDSMNFVTFSHILTYYAPTFLLNPFFPHLLIYSIKGKHLYFLKVISKFKTMLLFVHRFPLRLLLAGGEEYINL